MSRERRSSKSSKGSRGHNKNLTAQFVERYAARSDVQQTASGLWFRVIDAESATKELPQQNQRVKVHQRILLADGSVIDDTYKSGLAADFAIAEAIDGLQEALLTMPVGARYEWVIPPERAWGKRGNSGKIGPNAVLVFDIRLLAVES